MRMLITAEQITAIPGATTVLLKKLVGNLRLIEGTESTEDFLSKIIGRMSFNTYAWSHSHIQAMLTNDIVIEGMELYSPILNEAQINTEVPDNWPGGDIVDGEGTIVGKLTYAEYLRPIEVIGGTVLQFVGGPMDANKNIILPNFSQLKLQITKVGGFLTRSEVDAIRIITEETI